MPIHLQFKLLPLDAIWKPQHSKSIFHFNEHSLQKSYKIDLFIQLQENKTFAERVLKQNQITKCTCVATLVRSPSRVTSARRPSHRAATVGNTREGTPSRGSTSASTLAALPSITGTSSWFHTLWRNTVCN